MRCVLRPQYKQAMTLQRHHQLWKTALWAMSPSMKLLAKNKATEVHTKEAMNDWVIESKIHWKHYDGGSTSKCMQIVSKLTPSDCQWNFVVTLKCLYLVTKNWSRCTAIIINDPVYACTDIGKRGCVDMVVRTEGEVVLS
ncbi:hypothetical protein FNV43_RR03928 [Rhamnella rubrinervis]|uniref:Uncharacterized protein n=1 Tax=Rhamnella rubrinervis TaxID=2594499 RepID=A0A8K0MPR8_9ROSA|nr:hypothetical protein FNV43_RR03928 [Rhamnella rubrinervis]